MSYQKLDSYWYSICRDGTRYPSYEILVQANALIGIAAYKGIRLDLTRANLALDLAHTIVCHITKGREGLGTLPEVGGAEEPHLFHTKNGSILFPTFMSSALPLQSEDTGLPLLTVRHSLGHKRSLPKYDNLGGACSSHIIGTLPTIRRNILLLSLLQVTTRKGDIGEYVFLKNHIGKRLKEMNYGSNAGIPSSFFYKHYSEECPLEENPLDKVYDFLNKPATMFE